MRVSENKSSRAGKIFKRLAPHSKPPLSLPPHPLNNSRRRSGRSRRRRIGRHRCGIRGVHRLRRAIRINRGRIIKVNVQFTGGAAELAVVARTEHVTQAAIESGGGGGDGGTAVALLAVLDAGVVGGGVFAEADARFDRHACVVDVRNAIEETAAGGFRVAAFGDIAADLLDGCGWDVGRRVIDA